MSVLRGITWNHTRGFLPMVATGQRFAELNPGVEVIWQKRSLQEFADLPIQDLLRTYDLLVIDHPFCGYASAHDVLLPLDTVMPSEFLEHQSKNSVGLSDASYTFGGHKWALAIDAAAPVCGYRPDLLDRLHLEPPKTWEDLLGLADRGLVAVPAIGIDSLMNFYMFCVALDEEPFASTAAIVSESTGLQALGLLRNIIQRCDAACQSRNPIATWDSLAKSSSVALCPFAYGYSNYARSGYGENPLQFGPLVSVSGGARLRSVLGGAGLAISACCEQKHMALRYCEFVAAPQTQSTLYFDSGGQPGHRHAWLHPEVNRRAGNYFVHTLETLDEAWLRPRYDGYLPFQDEASELMHQFAKGELNEEQVLTRMNLLYRDSRGER